MFETLVNFEQRTLKYIFYFASNFTSVSYCNYWEPETPANSPEIGGCFRYQATFPLSHSSLFWSWSTCWNTKFKVTINLQSHFGGFHKSYFSYYSKIVWWRTEEIYNNVFIYMVKVRDIFRNNAYLLYFVTYFINVLCTL